MIFTRCSTDAGIVGAQFGVAAIAVGPAVGRVIDMYGWLYAFKVKARASGRPGPNAPTGDYRRSITSEFHGFPGGGFALVGTNKPQGRRLENGFVGRDSLGRMYNQRPFPHFGPALDEIEPPLIGALEAAVGETT